MVTTWKKFSALNVTNAAVLWTIWKSRNATCFQGVQWKKMEKIYGRCAGVIRNWNVLSKEAEAEKLKSWADLLETRSSRPPRIAWGAISISSYPGTAFRPSDHAGNGLVCVNALCGQ
jgi:hypothetical protein